LRSTIQLITITKIILDTWLYIALEPRKEEREIEATGIDETTKEQA
jgi:hypothetical protein